MPERARLAELIASDEVATRDQTLLAVEDLLSLCRSNFEVMYRPGDEPIDQSCPECHLQLPSKPRDRPDHIYHCRRSALSRTSTDVNYCFFCYHWFRNAYEWDTHCSEHLLLMSSLWCGVQRYCHTVISPGSCPLCLSNEQLSPSKRLQAWTRNYLLMQHVNRHIEEIIDFEFRCPRPFCDEQMYNRDLFRQHLNDIHGLTRSQKEAFDAQRKADAENNEFPSDINKQRKKKRKLNDRPEHRFIAWSPSARVMSQSFSSQSKVSAKVGRKRKMAADRVQDDNAQNSTDVFEIIDEKPHSDEDIICGSPHDSCLELGRNDAIFKCVDIPIDPALLSLDVTQDMRISDEVVEDKAVCKESHASVGIMDEMFCENSSKISTVIVHDVAENTTARQPTDQIQGLNFPAKTKRKKSSSITRSVRDEIENPTMFHTASGDPAFQCPICNRDVPRPSHSRFMNFSQQEAFCEDHRRREAEKEWIERGYPRIAWRRLRARMSRKISAIRDIVTACAFSFFRTELQAEIAKKKARKYRGVTNMIAGYYGPRGHQLM